MARKKWEPGDVSDRDRGQRRSACESTRIDRNGNFGGWVEARGHGHFQARQIVSEKLQLASCHPAPRSATATLVRFPPSGRIHVISQPAKSKRDGYPLHAAGRFARIISVWGSQALHRGIQGIQVIFLRNDGAAGVSSVSDRGGEGHQSKHSRRLFCRRRTGISHSRSRWVTLEDIAIRSSP